MIVNGGRITSGFYEPRPIAGPKTHPHGALDVAGGDGWVIAPCDGIARAYMMIRAPGLSWAEQEKPEIIGVPFRNYFYDIYGGIVSLIETTGRMHLMTHFYSRALQETFGNFVCVESIAENRWPSMVLYTGPVVMYKGDRIGKIGNAGYSTGPHVHWEVHNNFAALDEYAKRIDPSEYL